MAPSEHEDKLWAAGWLAIGIPAMVIGWIVGYCHDDAGTMVGTTLVTIVIIATNVPVLKGTR